MDGGGNGDGSGRIVVRNLTKRFGMVQAVRDLSFTVQPGQVTGFLGPNGAGKTTTLRVALGLVTPTDGEVTIGGLRYDQLAAPGRTVGAVLDSDGFHRGRRARAHLLGYTAAIGVPDQRADEVLTLVGLTDVANRKVGGFSLGMRQRLALATALLGDPQVLILDEPGSGLDPEGVAWLRGFLRSFAAAGRTVLVSSHQLAEISQTAEQVVIISQGTQVFEGRIDQVSGEHHDRLQVLCADPARLATALAERGFSDIQSNPDGGLTISGAPARTVGDVALAAGVAIYGLSRERSDLEQRFLALTVSQYQPVPRPGQPLVGTPGLPVGGPGPPTELPGQPPPPTPLRATPEQPTAQTQPPPPGQEGTR